MRLRRNEWFALAPAVLLLAPALVGARGCGGSVPIGRTCEVADCGAALGTPTIECPDGSIGGNTGRCIESNGQCVWEVRECPAETQCPAEIGADTVLTVAQCEACRGSVVGDPGDGRTRDPEFRCADGQPSIAPVSFGIEGGACCPAPRECDASECGPAPGAPAIECPDGSIGGNTGRCLRGAGGACGWEFRECPDPITCGGLQPEPVDCGEGFLCAYEIQAMCGAADDTGVCHVRPDESECAARLGPSVCGCDGRSYANECFAWAAGTSAASTGACEGESLCGYPPCDAAMPECPCGQVPELTPAGTCWSGRCVPTSACAPVACSSDAHCPSSIGAECTAATGRCVEGLCVW